MKPTSYIVGYKDSENADIRYFGPFVSDDIARYFRASLPMPLKGGWVRTVILQPFTAQEGYLVSQVIIRDRAEAA